MAEKLAWRLGRWDWTQRSEVGFFMCERSKLEGPFVHITGAKRGAGLPSVNLWLVPQP